MSDEEIIALYFARDEQALAQTDAKYGPYCFSLANAILPSREDAEEALNDTYLKAWQSMPPKKPAVLRLFLAKITRNLAFSRWRNLTAQKRGSGKRWILTEIRGISTATPFSGRTKPRATPTVLPPMTALILLPLPEAWASARS